MRDTPYATEIRTAEDPSGQRIERLFVKKNGREEIRFSWWKDGQLMIRPLDLPEDELLPLLRRAIDNEVFSEQFLFGLYSAIGSRLHTIKYERSAEQLRREDGDSQAGRQQTHGLIALLDTLDPIDEEWPEIDDSPPRPVDL